MIIVFTKEMNKELGISDNLDDDILDDIEAEMEKSPTVKASTAYVPAAAVPRQNGKLSQFAGEFWFPECRNCPCCKGFKHGCDCCKAGNGVDTCTDVSCIDGAFSAKVTEELASRSNTTNAPIAVVVSSDSNSNVSDSRYVVEPPTSPTTTSKTNASPAPAHLTSSNSGNFCKFEMSPSGCRFGAACHFKHMQSPNTLQQQPPSPYYRGNSGTNYPPQPPLHHLMQQMSMQPNTMYPPNVSGNVQKCLYFARGNCNAGESCRFSHY